MIRRSNGLGSDLPRLPDEGHGCSIDRHAEFMQQDEYHSDQLSKSARHRKVANQVLVYVRFSAQQDDNIHQLAHAERAELVLSGRVR